jgi:hypothetical protein
MISLRAIESDMTNPHEIETVENAIHLVRGHRIMLDSDLAAIYGVTTKRLNEQLRRNGRRFPSDFAFRLTREEFTNLRSQIATSKKGGRRYSPWAFTEHGAIMLASVLNSDVAIEASVRVVRAFVRLREIISANSELAAKFAHLERRLDSHDEAIAQLFAAIRQLLAPTPEKKREIGFHARERAGRYRTKPRT